MSNHVLRRAVDCDDAAATANFWARALGDRSPIIPARHTPLSWPATRTRDRGWRSTRFRSRNGQETGCTSTLRTTDFDAECDRLMALGAQKLRDSNRTEHGGRPS